MSSEDDELEVMLESLPILPLKWKDQLTSVSSSPPNAKIFWNAQLSRLEIFLEKGGWLGIKRDNILADLAPFSD